MTIKEFMKLKSSDNGQNNRYTVWDADTLREIGEFYAYDLAWTIKGGKFVTLYVIAAVKSMKGKTEGITARV